MKCLMLAWLLGFSGLVSSAVAEDATRRGGEVGASNSSGLAAVVVKLSREKAEVLEKIAKLKGQIPGFRKQLKKHQKRVSKLAKTIRYLEGTGLDVEPSYGLQKVAAEKKIRGLKNSLSANKKERKHLAQRLVDLGKQYDQAVLKHQRTQISTVKSEIEKRRRVEVTRSRVCHDDEMVSSCRKELLHMVKQTALTRGAVALTDTSLDIFKEAREGNITREEIKEELTNWVQTSSKQIGKTKLSRKLVNSGIKLSVTAKYDVWGSVSNDQISALLGYNGDSPPPPPPLASRDLHRLTIVTAPSDAKVRILNIKPKYSDGMLLASGEYHVEVSKAGYPKVYDEWLVLGNADKTVQVTLKQPSSEGGEVAQFADMPFIWVPKGCFRMGSPSYENGRDDDEKQHRVCLDQGYWLGQTEITQGQWQSVMGSNPSGFKDCGLDCPVEQVSFEDVQEFIKKLNHKHGGGFGLPTESEWEYACRSGGKNETYCGGNEIDELAWYAGNIDSKTYQVAQKEPNGLGLYDMSGNVYEWTCSDWNASYVGQEKVCLNKKGSSVRRALRGGSWGSLPRWVRAANRSRNNTVYRYNYNGARLRFSRGG